VAVVMVGWVFFRADSLPQALSFLAEMARPGHFAAPDAALSILLNAQSVAALVAGSLFAAPLLPALLRRLGTPRAEPPRPDLPGRLETRSVHALPIPWLAAGFTLSAAILAGSTLNPFLYFRF
jgi:alginate O-acetyltransferase complex protein AlgI